MKPVSSEYVPFILRAPQFLKAELFTVAFRDGNVEYYTDLDIDVNFGGNTYLANSLRFDGLRLKTSVGLQVDEQQLRISAYPTETFVAGASFFNAVENGILDGAYVTRARAFWAVHTGVPSRDYVLWEPTDVIALFIGRVATINKIGRSHVELTLKSPLSLLDIDMPRNVYSAGCLWTLYDSGCTVDRAAYTTGFTVVDAGKTFITVASVVPETGADGIAFYVQGRLKFTSGVNNGFQTMIRDNDSVNFYPQYPLPEIPAVGDSFEASAGCVKTDVTCAAKFANIANFRGFPRIPPIAIGV